MPSEASYDYSGGNGSITNRSEKEMASNEMRKFDTGATRSAIDGKLDFEGFLSPLALESYARYMHKHRKQADGKMRNSDNWQKGIPFVSYMKSMWRHVVDLWFLHRGHLRNDQKDGHAINKEEALCGIIFNSFGYLHELLISSRKIEEAARRRRQRAAASLGRTVEPEEGERS